MHVMASCLQLCILMPAVKMCDFGRSHNANASAAEGWTVLGDMASVVYEPDVTLEG